MSRTTTLITVGLVAALAGGGAAIASAAGGDDDATDKPVTGSALQRASEAALASVPGGKVTGTEAGDEEGAYEIEVTRPDGTQVDVHLDRRFNVLDARADGAEDAEEDTAGDD